MLTRAATLATGAATACIIGFLPAPPGLASPGCSSGATIGGSLGSVSCEVSVPGSSSPSSTGATGSSSVAGSQTAVVDPCSYVVVDVANSLLNADRVLDELNETTSTTGIWYERSCPGGALDTISWAPPGTEAVVPSVQVLAQQATASVTVVTPGVSLDPYFLLEDGRRATLKNAQTWFWVDVGQWVPLTPRVEVGPVWVEATVTPQMLIVHPNDGVTGSYTCVGPGTPVVAGTPMDEPSPTCSLQFTEQTEGGSWPVAVQVSYSVSWVGFDGSASVSGTLPDLVSAPITVPLAVLSAKPELIDADYD